MNSTFKIVSTKVLINDVDYTVSSKATWDNSWDDTKPYSYTLINSWGNLDSLGVKNIKTGDKIVVKFTVVGTNYDVAGEVIMPNAKPTETPTAEPTKEPKVVPTHKPTVAPTKKPSLKNTTITVKNGKKKVSSVTVKGLKKGKVKFKLVSKKTSTYKKASKTITVNIK